MNDIREIQMIQTRFGRALRMSPTRNGATRLHRRGSRQERSSLAALGVACLLHMSPSIADSTGPLLAAYYDDYLALCAGTVFEWRTGEMPRPTITGMRQVGVGKRMRYGLQDDGSLLAWSDNPAAPQVLIDRVRQFHAGLTGLLVIRYDASLWHVETRRLPVIGESGFETPRRLADNVATASVGDGANYYVTRDGALRVHGNASRGQYGDGRLERTDFYVVTANDVRQVVAHTGHALHLKRDGSIWGTGGNIYGPLAKHGYGDKAARWGKLLDNATAIATGASHSLALRSDGSLWIWGRNEGLTPKQVIDHGVLEAAAGTDHSVALADENLWFWRTGEQPRRLAACPGPRDPGISRKQ